MKKIYTLLFFLVPFLSQSQTITQADLPTAGISWTTGNDSTYSDPIPAGGTGQTWNYAALVNGYKDTLGFQDPAGTPYAAAFPTSNLSGYDAETGGYTYLTSNSTGLYIDGIAGGTVNLQYNPSILYVPVPFSFGDTRTSFGRSQIDTSLLDTTGVLRNYRYISRVESIFEADANGSLTIPSGTYPNVLRIKITTISNDSIFIMVPILGYIPLFNFSSQTIAYRYFTSGLQVNYLLGLEADSLGTTAVSSEYYIERVTSVPSIQQNRHLITYPNPAVNSLNFKLLDGNYSIIVYDNNSSEVIRTSLLSDKPLNTEMLKPGLYHYQIINNRNDHIDNGSFIIQH